MKNVTSVSKKEFFLFQLIFFCYFLLVVQCSAVSSNSKTVSGMNLLPLCGLAMLSMATASPDQRQVGKFPILPKELKLTDITMTVVNSLRLKSQKEREKETKNISYLNTTRCSSAFVDLLVSHDGI